MNIYLRNGLALVGGLVLGSVVNMALISVSASIIPPPNGADVTTMEGLKASLPLFEPKHFLFPFLAHALGTLVGAIIAALIAGSHHMKWALGVGAFFLLGGIANVLLLPSPLWFSLLDILGAYIPMAYLGGRLGARGK